MKPLDITGSLLSLKEQNTVWQEQAHFLPNHSDIRETQKTGWHLQASVVYDSDFVFRGIQILITATPMGKWMNISFNGNGQTENWIAAFTSWQSQSFCYLDILLNIIATR